MAENPHSLDIHLDISREQFLRWYQGVGSVRARCTDGRTIAFPAKILQPYITHDGVQGYFRIYFDENNKFREIRRYR